MKFSIKDFFSKCDQIRRKLRIWSYLLNKSLMENFIFCGVRDNERSPSHLAMIIRPHCIKSVGIRSYSSLYFPVFGLNTEYLSVFSRNAGKWDQNNSKYGHFSRSTYDTRLKESFIRGL